MTHSTEELRNIFKNLLHLVQTDSHLDNWSHRHCLGYPYLRIVIRWYYIPGPELNRHSWDHMRMYQESRERSELSHFQRNNHHSLYNNQLFEVEIIVDDYQKYCFEKQKIFITQIYFQPSWKSSTMNWVISYKSYPHFMLRTEQRSR